MKLHTVEKIGGTSMSDYQAVRDNIVLRGGRSEVSYQRVFVVSAYGGITNALLEHKKTAKPGVFALFANTVNDDSWVDALEEVATSIYAINDSLFDGEDLRLANEFISQRLADAKQCMADLQRLCEHGHFALEAHLATVREMLSSIGEAHSAWNTAKLLQRDGINARFVDLTGAANCYWLCAQPRRINVNFR